MNLDLGAAWDAVKDGTKEIAEAAHEKTSSFHEKYVSKVIPDCGKYGDEAKFVAEMVPGVAEYNAIKDGDWVAFAVAAGIDIAAIGAAAFSMGAGYAAVKGGGAAAKAGVRVAAKEIAEAGAEAIVRETVEAGVKKAVKETAEAGIKAAVKETAEAGVEVVAREAAESAAQTVARETVEAGTEKAVKEIAEEGTEKIAKEAAEQGAKSIDKVEQLKVNRDTGKAREEKVLKELISEYGEENVIEQAYLRNKDGIAIKDPVTGEKRRIDFIVTCGNKIIKSIEVTSEKASKIAQMAKESSILEEAAKNGGAFIKDYSGELIEFTKDVITEIWRLP